MMRDPMAAPYPRRITLCADDYGLSEGVNRGIRDLIALERLNATSVMTVTPAFTYAEVAALKALRAEHTIAIGLHVTLTAPFRPLTIHFRPLDGTAFPPLGAMLARALVGRLDREIIETEIASQLAAFIDMFGAPPDFVDGHQHVHIFPTVRDAFLAAVKSAAPKAWVRQCGRPAAAARPWTNPKALLLDVLSATFRTRATALGFSMNPAFAGAYDFSARRPFGEVFETFLHGLPDGGLVMCHPGFVDETLRALDPVTDQRAREYAFFASDKFLALRERENVTLS